MYFQFAQRVHCIIDMKLSMQISQTQLSFKLQHSLQCSPGHYQHALQSICQCSRGTELPSGLPYQSQKRMVLMVSIGRITRMVRTEMEVTVNI
jgi:hypothetical protein